MSQNHDTPEDPCPGCNSPGTCAEFGRCIMDPLDDDDGVAVPDEGGGSPGPQP